ncbi:transducin family protein / WD-40 repeat family protein [Pelomyxa schiedti]|nr:transducin family protein / WD-40 repeat family protein [Pelomyxa schiedti]
MLRCPVPRLEPTHGSLSATKMVAFDIVPTASPTSSSGVETPRGGLGCVVSVGNRLVCALVPVLDACCAVVGPTQQPQVNERQTHPINITPAKVFEVPSGLTHDICTIASNKTCTALGSVDSSGVASIMAMPSFEGDPSLTPTVIAPKRISSELGWAGIAFHTTKHDNFATAHQFSNTISAYDGEREIRTLFSSQYPNQIDYLSLSQSAEPLLCVAEYNQLCIYDLKAPSPCIARLAPSPQALFAMTAADSVVLAGGAHRLLHCYDSRKWTPLHSISCSKFAITGIKTSPLRSSMCFVRDTFTELVGCTWATPTAPICEVVRSDGRWLGLQCTGKDTLVGFTDAGSLYVLPGATRHCQLDIEKQHKRATETSSAAVGPPSDNTKRPRL